MAQTAHMQMGRHMDTVGMAKATYCEVIDAFQLRLTCYQSPRVLTQLSDQHACCETNNAHAEGSRMFLVQTLAMGSYQPLIELITPIITGSRDKNHHQKERHGRGHARNHKPNAIYHPMLTRCASACVPSRHMNKEHTARRMICHIFVDWNIGSECSAAVLLLPSAQRQCGLHLVCTRSGVSR